MPITSETIPNNFTKKSIWNIWFIGYSNQNPNVNRRVYQNKKHSFWPKFGEKWYLISYRSLQYISSLNNAYHCIYRFDPIDKNWFTWLHVVWVTWLGYSNINDSENYQSGAQIWSCIKCDIIILTHIDLINDLWVAT